MELVAPCKEKMMLLKAEAMTVTTQPIKSYNCFFNRLLKNSTAVHCVLTEIETYRLKISETTHITTSVDTKRHIRESDHG
jgi:hypothetical protein